jgi:hypothetical protein
MIGWVIKYASLNLLIAAYVHTKKKNAFTLKCFTSAFVLLQLTRQARCGTSAGKVHDLVACLRPNLPINNSGTPYTVLPYFESFFLVQSTSLFHRIKHIFFAHLFIYFCFYMFLLPYCWQNLSWGNINPMKFGHNMKITKTLQPFPRPYSFQFSMSRSCLNSSGYCGVHLSNSVKLPGDYT